MLLKFSAISCLKAGLNLKLYSISIIANATSLSVMRDVLYDVCIVFGSKWQNDNFKSSFNNLKAKILNICVKHVPLVSETVCCDGVGCSQCQFVMEIMSSSDVDEQQMPQPLRNTGSHLAESDYLLRCVTSRFGKWAQDIRQTASTVVESGCSHNLSVNRYYSPAVLDKIITLYMPTLPLWSSLMLNDVKRHSAGYALTSSRRVLNLVKASTSLPPRTTGSQEQRFTILKHMVLAGRKTSRLDDFASLLMEHFSTVQKDYLAVYFHQLRGHRFKVPVNATKPLKETWAKKENTFIDQHALNLGKYQQSPQKG